MNTSSPHSETTSTKKSPTRRAVLGGALGLLLSAGGATAWALDRFVVDHVEISDVTAYEASAASSSASASAGSSTTVSAAVVSANGFTSHTANLAIEKVTTGSGDATLTYFTARLDLNDATILRSAFAQDSFGQNIIETTSAIAENHDALFAINGDYYGFRDTGIVIRNGVSYRDAGAREGLAFYKDGTVSVYDETATNAAQLLEQGVWNTLSFGPSLLADGAVKPGIDAVEVD